MQTSYFAKYTGQNAISIAAITPVGFNGRIYKKLAPPKWLLHQFKENGDKIAYEKIYREKVLAKLDARKVYQELGADSVLLCYEGLGSFCHRHIVAKWFFEKLKIEVSEYEDSKNRQLSFY